MNKKVEYYLELVQKQGPNRSSSSRSDDSGIFYSISRKLYEF